MTDCVTTDNVNLVREALHVHAPQFCACITPFYIIVDMHNTDFPCFSSTSGNRFAASSPFSDTCAIFIVSHLFVPFYSHLVTAHAVLHPCFCDAFPLKGLMEGVNVTEADLEDAPGQQALSPTARIRKVATSGGKLTDTEGARLRLPK